MKLGAPTEEERPSYELYKVRDIDVWVGNQAARGAVTGEIEIDLRSILFFFKSLIVSGINPNARVGL